MLKEMRNIAAGGDGARATCSGGNLPPVWAGTQVPPVQSFFQCAIYLIFQLSVLLMRMGTQGPEVSGFIRSEGLKVGPIFSYLDGVSGVSMACAEILPRPGLWKDFLTRQTFVMLPSTTLAI